MIIINTCLEWLWSWLKYFINPKHVCAELLFSKCMNIGMKTHMVTKGIAINDFCKKLEFQNLIFSVLME